MLLDYLGLHEILQEISIIIGRERKCICSFSRQAGKIFKPAVGKGAFSMLLLFFQKTCRSRAVVPVKSESLIVSALQ